MFSKTKNERPVIIDQYDSKVLALYRSRDIVRGWAQAVKWYSLPLEVLIKDTPEWREAEANVKSAQLSLRNAMGSYDADVYEFIEWVKRHFDELPENYQQYEEPKTSMDEIRYAIHDINNHSYFYFKRLLNKN